MHRNIYIFLVFLAGLVGVVAAVPLSPNTHRKGTVDLAPSGTVPSSTNSVAFDVHSIQSTPVPLHGLTTRRTPMFTALAFLTPGPHATEPPSGSQVLPTIVTASPQTPPIILPATPLTPNLEPNMASQTQPAPESRNHLSTSLPRELATSTFSLSDALRSSSPPSNANIVPTVRYILIAILAGVPTLTVVGFIITLRWRRAHRKRELLDLNGLSNPKEGRLCRKDRKSTRFSTFFGVNHASPETWRKGRSHLYATSIHSTAGIAGLGAHRGGGENAVPPMIQYVQPPKSGSRAELDDKANFENPFGTPPPIGGGFVIAPSRVSPHIPQTPPLHLVQLSSALLVDNARNETNAVPKFSSLDTRPHKRFGNTPSGQIHQREHNQKGRIAHSEAIFNHQFLSPNFATSMRTYKQPLPSDIHNNLRTSVAPSVYGGIASPRIPGLETPIISPPLPYLTSSPISGQTPMLPYLPPPAKNIPPAHDRWQSVTPIIVIQAASTADSASEYGDDSTTESNEEVRRPSLSAARRDGLVGSPHGYVPPSTTFSTVSSYSVSSVPGIASNTYPSAWFINCHDSSSSSNPNMSASSSDDSSVAVKATPMNSGQQLRRINTTEAKSLETGTEWLPINLDALKRSGKPRQP